jgi:hypothetical protein
MDFMGLCEISGSIFSIQISKVNVHKFEFVGSVKPLPGDFPQLGYIDAAGNADGTVTIKCNDDCPCEKRIRYISESASSPNDEFKIIVKDYPWNDVPFGQVPKILKALHYTDVLQTIRNKYYEAVKHQYSKNAATEICRSNPGRNDGVPYGFGTSP